MHISSLTDYNNTLFGYNKKFHKSIQKQLNAKNSIESNSLANCDRSLLKTEDRLILMENLKLSSTQKYKELSEHLIREKRILAGKIDNYDSRLQYSQSLMKQYKEEISTAKTTEGRRWRARLYSGLKIDIEAQRETLKSQLKNQILTIVSPSSKNNNGKNTHGADGEISEVIPLFIPNEYSPKGLFDVVGSNDIKEKLQDDLIPYVSSQNQMQKDYEEYGIRAPRGFLFYGPPGCGKTYITQALSAETGMPMYTMDVSKVGSMWINKSSNNVREAFEYIFQKAKESQTPIILFMDEVDSLAFDRSSSTSGAQEDSKVVTTLLKMVESARDNNVVVIAATNRYDMLDSAFKDRFDGQIYFPLPNEEQIERLLTANLISRSKGLELGYDEESIKELSKMLIGFSNRAIIQIIDDGAKIARRRSRDNIHFEDIKTAIENSDHERIKEKAYKQEAKKPAIGFSI